MPIMEEMYPSGPLASASSRMDQCSGCLATDVSLLACDDIDGKGAATDPSQRARWVLRKRFRIVGYKDGSLHRLESPLLLFEFHAIADDMSIIFPPRLSTSIQVLFELYVGKEGSSILACRQQLVYRNCAAIR
jgi:hypothetical protein